MGGRTFTRSLFIDGRCLVEWGGMDEDEDAGDSAKAVHREIIYQVVVRAKVLQVEST